MSLAGESEKMPHARLERRPGRLSWDVNYCPRSIRASAQIASGAVLTPVAVRGRWLKGGRHTCVAVESLPAGVALRRYW